MKPFEILLVDDNPGDVRLVREALRTNKVSHHLHEIGDGAQAMAFVHREDPFANAPRPDLILLDLNLPRKDGREVLAEIKQDADLRRIPVVVLTGSRAEHDILQSYDLHANCFITKPGNLEQFVGAINSIKKFWLRIVSLPPDARDE